jgi:hypothetical protein
LKILILRAFCDLTHTGTCSFEGTILTESEQAVVTSQTAIGWHHFLFGRLSKEWSTAQRLHILAEDQNADKYSGPAWSAKIISHLWRVILAHWGVQNEALHGVKVTASTKRSRIEPLTASSMPASMNFSATIKSCSANPWNPDCNNPSAFSQCGSA